MATDGRSLEENLEVTSAGAGNDARVFEHYLEVVRPIGYTYEGSVSFDGVGSLALGGSVLPPSAADFVLSPLYGQLGLPGEWLCWYDAVDDGALVDPDSEGNPWAEHLTGVVAHSTSDIGVFDMADASGLTALNYDFALTGFDNAIGSIFDVRVKVDASAAGVDEGVLLALDDGTVQFRVWLRTDGVNIDGLPDQAVDMTQWRNVRLVMKGIDTSLYIDDNLIHNGYFSALTDLQKVTFGTVVGYGTATTDWRWARARAMRPYERITEGGFLVTIGPICGTLNDLAIGDTRLYQYDHSLLADFDFAEPPIFKTPGGTLLEDIGVIVTLSLGTDGDQIVVEFYNESYAGAYGYGDSYGYGYGYGAGGTGPDISFCWTRRGLTYTP